MAEHGKCKSSCSVRVLCDSQGRQFCLFNQDLKGGIDRIKIMRLKWASKPMKGEEGGGERKKESDFQFVSQWTRICDLKSCDDDGNIFLFTFHGSPRPWKLF